MKGLLKMETSIKTITGLCGLIVIAFLVNAITNFKFGSIKEFQIPKTKSYVTVDNVDKTLDCLALNIYKEAGHESFEGKVAVAQVTINRADHPKFPKDICSVVFEKNVIMERVVCQFSWYCEHGLVKKPKDKAYQESYAVAKKVLLEGFRLDMLKDAIYYHAVYVSPNWPYQKIGTIGNHIFYRGKRI